MDEPVDSLDAFWERLLSRQPDLIYEAFHTLLEDEREAVVIHLRAMAVEEGWHSEQRISAREALKTLGFEWNE